MASDDEAVVLGTTASLEPWPAAAAVVVVEEAANARSTSADRPSAGTTVANEPAGCEDSGTEPPSSSMANACVREAPMGMVGGPAARRV
jgi:hypothetical protein